MECLNTMFSLYAGCSMKRGCGFCWTHKLRITKFALSTLTDKEKTKHIEP